MTVPDPGAVQPELPGFRVVLANFTGPFDLLLQLIGKKKLDVTEVALAQVTDDFIAYTRQLGETADLSEITEFLVIAATLLDLKTARLLPRGEVDSEEDLALLESRDLLFARLLQYRAYAEVATMMGQWALHAPRRYPRSVSMEPAFVDLMPPVTLGVDAAGFAELAAAAFRPKPAAVVGVDHIHAPAVSVPEQAGILLRSLQAAGSDAWLSFVTLAQSCDHVLQVVGRFLAVLELVKAGAIEFAQEDTLGELSLRWTGLDVDPAVVAAGTWE
ncbi:segregation and condensation protein A [Corynebacterium choanae]|uniref:segregation and condensation protein A n=1 Tax=Corynebacterium choanae TaxID=1862358 RepID=UPI001FECADD4|nr:segregation/condensation protein A [Corynebacterium choanae]